MNSDYTESNKYILRYKLLKILPSFLYPHLLKYKYKKTYNLTLDLKNPSRLSEKIQWLKLYDNSKRKTFFANKLLAKRYVQKFLPNLKTAKLYDEGTCLEEIDFEKLPNSFILKTNHAWKTNVIVEEKARLTRKDIKKLSKLYKKILKINFAYWSYYELLYKGIKPKVFAEELLIDSFRNISPNYEVYCFNGNPEFILYRAVKDNILQQDVFNINWEHLNFEIEYGGYFDAKKPDCLEDLIKYSKALCKRFKFVRVDFMQYNNQLYFCEMTFLPYSGFIKFIPDSYDKYYGEMLKL